VPLISLHFLNEHIGLSAHGHECDASMLWLGPRIVLIEAHPNPSKIRAKSDLCRPVSF
jgi:hypothetical protein